MSIKFQPKRGCIDHHKIWFPKAVGTFIREGLLIGRGRAYKRLLPIVTSHAKTYTNGFPFSNGKFLWRTRFV